jgi:hypothetical protein
MAHDNNVFEQGQNAAPFALSQNPSPNPVSGQDYLTDKQALVQRIMATFRSVLPSNYVSQTNGPWYSLQFQAMAEQLAEIQIAGTEVYKDSDWDFTRTDFLWQVLGSLVFPGATDKSGIPDLNGDTAYRAFLHKMSLLLLQGATKATMESGLEALDPSIIATITERYLESPPRDPNGEYTIDDQFLVDITIEGFPLDPIVLQRNAQLVLSALKPAHVLYQYSYLFRDAFGSVADDEGGMVLDLDSYYYDDLRRWCLGAKSITGTGSTLSNRALFSDPLRSFASVRRGAILIIESGVNAGQYTVMGKKALLYGYDPNPYPYTTSSGGSGTLYAMDGETVIDTSQDWGSMPVDTILYLVSGPNAGSYRLDTVLGSSGGPMGTVGISGDTVRVSPSILQVSKRMPSATSGQSYSVTVDRLGTQIPRVESGEDVSIQFIL